MSESVIVALISSTGVVIAALIGLAGIIIAKGGRSKKRRVRDEEEDTSSERHPFFYLMLLAGVLNLAAYLFAEPWMREMFKDEAIPALKLMFVINGVGALVVAFFNRHRA